MEYETKIGFGYDVHKFCDGDKIYLCGVEIPHDKALKGHSDADVAIHALCDAIYGSIAMGDIGDHFPPSSPEFKNMHSSFFLEHAKSLLEKQSASIINIDITLVCEKPKIQKYRQLMKENLAKILKITPERINVKATTTEKLGFEGREEGIASHAVISIKSLIK